MKAWLFVSLVTVGIFLSVLGLVWSRHEARRLHIGMEYLEQDLLELEEEWGRLLLEQGSWTDRERIATLARERLDMQAPDMRDGSWRVLEKGPGERGPERTSPVSVQAQ